MGIGAVVPWMLDALTLYLTMDQEIELRQIERLLRGQEPTEGTPPEGLGRPQPGATLGEEGIDLGELAEFMENERADYDEECHCEHI